MVNGYAMKSVNVTHAVFDFDGTLSWLRHGWPHLMLETCLRYAPFHWRNDSSLRRGLLEDILSLNGKPSINQIRLFCERVGDPDIMAQAGEIQTEYARELKLAIRDRLTIAKTNHEAFLIYGAGDIVRELHRRGVKNFILSGTDETDVRNEAEVLGLVSCFPGGIFGAPSSGNFSKMDAIHRIIAEESITGRNLVVFGDGPVEIACGKSVGAITIGVASDEANNGSHQVDPVKLNHLTAAGADLIVADYADREGLLRQILGDEAPGARSVTD